jgi:hypothetical protein
MARRAVAPDVVEAVVPTACLSFGGRRGEHSHIAIQCPTRRGLAEEAGVALDPVRPISLPDPS